MFWIILFWFILDIVCISECLLILYIFLFLFLIFLNVMFHLISCLGWFLTIYIHLLLVFHLFLIYITMFPFLKNYFGFYYKKLFHIYLFSKANCFLHTINWLFLLFFWAFLRFKIGWPNRRHMRILLLIFSSIFLLMDLMLYWINKGILHHPTELLLIYVFL